MEGETTERNNEQLYLVVGPHDDYVYELVFGRGKHYVYKRLDGRWAHSYGIDDFEYGQNHRMVMVTDAVIAYWDEQERKGGGHHDFLKFQQQGFTDLTDTPLSG